MDAGMVDFGKKSGLAEAAALSSARPDEPSIVDEIRLLIAAARQSAEAELAYQSARAKLLVKATAWIAGGGALALALLFFVLMALVVGLLLALAPMLGPWGALGAVVGGLLIATLMAGLVAWHGLRKFIALLRDGKDPA